MERWLMLLAPPYETRASASLAVNMSFALLARLLGTGHRFAARGAIQDGKRYMDRLKDRWLLISPVGGFRVYGAP